MVKNQKELLDHLCKELNDRSAEIARLSALLDSNNIESGYYHNGPDDYIDKLVKRVTEEYSDLEEGNKNVRTND